MVIMHNDRIPDNILYRYAQQNSIEVLDNENVTVPVIKYPLLSFENDLVRHDPKQIRKVVEDLL